MQPHQQPSNLFVLEYLISVSVIASFSSFMIGLESIRAFDRVPAFTSKFRARQQDFLRAFTAGQAVERFTMVSAISLGVTCFITTLATSLLLLSRQRILVTPGTAGVTLGYAAILSLRLPTMLLMSSKRTTLL